MHGRARTHAAALLAENVRVLRAAGAGEAERVDALEARLAGGVGGPIGVRMVREGRFFGGAYALELAGGPVLPRTRGLRARGRGVFRLRGVSFSARRGDAAGERLARSLGADAALGEALARVHFDRIRIEPDGRAVIRQLGGSVVWMLLPPVVRPVPLVADQARATLAALAAFARSGGEAAAPSAGLP